MENFVLYEDIGHGNQCVVYKGRRKGTINFVAINCIEKSKRHFITNSVRLIHEITHNNIVKFYEWYETSNHLWMIVELCTGGSLKTVIEQDQQLPESCIKTFGSDLVNGLHHMHSLGIVYTDLKPSNIMLDGPGVLKFADFGLSRMEGEDINELFEQFSDAGLHFASGGEGLDNKLGECGLPREIKNNGTPMYMAPELLEGGEPSMASDLWSLGCVLYEMFTGHPPFLADNFDQLKDKIVNQDFQPPKARGSRIAVKPSSEFQSLLDGLLKKNSEDRMDWTELLIHPFWQNSLHHLVQDDVEKTDLRESLRRSVVNFANTLVSESRQLQTLDNVNNQSINPIDSVREFSQDDDNHSDTTSNLRPKSALGNADVQFTLSSRPPTAMLAEDTHLTTQRTILPSETDIFRQRQDVENMDSLVYHSTDFIVPPILDDLKKSGLFKYDPKMLTIQPYSGEKLLSMSVKDKEKHCISLIEALSSLERGAKHAHLLNYCATLGVLADVLVSRNLLIILAQQVKEAQQLEQKSKICRVIATIANNVVHLNESVNISEALSILSDLLKDGFRNAKLKSAILPAVGELLYLIASQEESQGGVVVDNWTVPAITNNLVIRCLRDGEENVVNHFAVKIIENIATKSGSIAQKFANVDVGHLLWYIYVHNNNDQARISAVMGLCLLSRYNPAVFQSVVEKVGLPKMLTSMSSPVSKVQQAVITMFLQLMSSDARTCRFLQDKEFTLHVMRLLESPIIVIRSKAFLALQQLLQSSHETFLFTCENRLVMYVERDSRKQVSGNFENNGFVEYLSKCLDQLVNTMVNAVPAICKEILSSLDGVIGRKHPSTIQLKQLKSSLPLTPILRHCVTSAVLRPKITNNSFMNSLATFIGHILSMDSGATQVPSSSGAEEFIHNIFTIIEAIIQHPAIFSEYSALAVDKFLPTFASLIFSSSGDTSALSLRLFSEVTFVVLNHEFFEAAKHQTHIRKLHQIVAESLLPKYEEILLQQDPLPSYGLRLLLFLIEQHPAFIRDLEKLGLIPVLFQLLEDHRINPISSVVKHIIGIINCCVGRKEFNIKELYDQGLVRQLSYLVSETSQTCLNAENGISDVKSATTLLVVLLDTINGALRYVSEVVRRALEARKGGHGSVTHETEEAEELLLVNKPLSLLISPLTQLLINEDSDVADVSLKCLSLLVQLYGADTANSLSPKCIECYTTVLKNADAKKQKVILRILKRMITMDRYHVDLMKEHGSSLTEAISHLVHTASSNADVTMSTLAAEILKIIN